MGFTKEDLNNDNICNLVFWLGMTCWVYFSLPAHPMLALSSFVGMPFLIKKLFPLTVVEVPLESPLEQTASVSTSIESTATDDTVKEEVSTSRECLANSEGKIVSDNAPYLFCVLLSPLVIGFPIAYIFDNFMNSIDVALASFIGIAVFFFIPTFIFIVCNRPISLLFDSRAWYLQGWRRIRRGSYSNSSSDLFSNSSSSNSDWYYSSSYSAFSGNIHNHRR